MMNYWANSRKKNLWCLVGSIIFFWGVSTTELYARSPNGVILQYFHWYLPPNGELWNRLHRDAEELSKAGFTAVWLPPAYKGNAGIWDNGYGAYDLYDLGEFDQKGTIRTKYGTKEEYLRAIETAQQHQIAVYADIVLNHKSGADRTETVQAFLSDGNNRLRDLMGPVEVEIYTGFDFPNRGGIYSDFKWRWYHFNGADFALNRRDGNVIYRFANRQWNTVYSTEFGNYDYLFGANIDFDQPEVVSELKNWGLWYTNLANLDGFRLDGIKHIKIGFFNDWLTYLRGETGRELFTVGEYWDYDVGNLIGYLNLHNDNRNRMSLFDAPLHYRFHIASRSKGYFDMGSLLENTLMKLNPYRAVTLVENHDTQPLQALESPVEDWFKPLAYATILLREEGYPTVFYADYYGASYRDYGRDGNQYDIRIQPQKEIIDQLLSARRLFAYGRQRAYFDDRDVVGWTREGDDQSREGLAVLMSDGPGGKKWMEVGRQHAGECFQDLLKNEAGCVTINKDGWGEFRTSGGRVSVWVGEP